MPLSSKLDRPKRMAAARAIEEVEDGMILGFGSGSIAAFAIEAMAARIAKNLRVVGIPTSETMAALTRRPGLPLTSFADHRRVGLAIDGADQVARGSLDLVKGLGGALLREKMVASASDRTIVVVDETKLVDRLGGNTPLPMEIGDPLLSALPQAGRNVVEVVEPCSTVGRFADHDQLADLAWRRNRATSATSSSESDYEAGGHGLAITR